MQRIVFLLLQFHLSLNLYFFETTKIGLELSGTILLYYEDTQWSQLPKQLPTYKLKDPRCLLMFPLSISWEPTKNINSHHS